jgi:DNA-binding transcriptional MerR regulator
MKDLLAFTAEHVSNLTGLSIRQLYYWDKTGLFSPQYADERRDHPFSRIYSFRDVVSLRILATLRNGFHVPLQGLRKANEWLRAHYESPWSSLTLFVRGREVFFPDPDTESRRSALHPERLAMPIEMQEVAQQLRREADRLRERRAEQIGQIERRRWHPNPRCCHLELPLLWP